MKAFNTHRKNVVPGKRFQKYVLYAIGEIILVVVGILIALQVNSCAEERANSKEVDQIFEVVVADLKADKRDINIILTEYEKREKYFDRVLAENPVRDSLKNCEGCRKIFTNLKTATLRRKGSNLLKKHSNVPKQKAEMVQQINSFYTTMDSFLPQIKQTITDNILSNVKYMRDNFDWFADFSTHKICNSDCRSYFEGDGSNYKNLIAYLHIFVYENYLPQLKTYKTEATQLIKEIENSKTE